MSLSTLEYDTVNAIAAICKQVISELEPALRELQQIYDASGGVKETLTQEELDEVVAFSDLSKTTLDDAAYALTTVLLPAIGAGYASLAQVAARSRGFAPPVPTPPPVLPPGLMTLPGAALAPPTGEQSG